MNEASIIIHHAGIEDRNMRTDTINQVEVRERISTASYCAGFFKMTGILPRNCVQPALEMISFQLSIWRTGMMNRTERKSSTHQVAALQTEMNIKNLIE